MAQGHRSRDLSCSKALPKDLCTPVTLSKCKGAFCWVKFNFASQSRTGRLNWIVTEEDEETNETILKVRFFFLQSPRKQTLEMVMFKVYRAAQPTHSPRPLGRTFEPSHSRGVIPKVQALEMADENVSLSAWSMWSKVQSLA